jgi:hypothetical protein
MALCVADGYGGCLAIEDTATYLISVLEFASIVHSTTLEEQTKAVEK